ncbi:MAG: haloacid dehalogenase type II [Desulfobulbaceae bacterium]|nr:MAG: haloacid dehalogenase type II [Desulfobulbaceae bacterium]
MTTTIGFDVYGTLIDTAGVTEALRQFAGERTVQFSNLWREKQLEYSFRRALMQNYVHFGFCTRFALDYTCTALGVDIPDQDKEELLAGYKVLPPFADAAESLPVLKDQGFRLFAFSNGKPDDVASLLEHSGISNYFEDVISTDEIKSFKPNPAVYSHFLRRSRATGREAWLISGNPFDVIGAVSAGMRAAWVKRTAEAIFDPWEIEPTITIGSLAELADGIRKN